MRLPFTVFHDNVKIGCRVAFMVRSNSRITVRLSCIFRVMLLHFIRTPIETDLPQWILFLLLVASTRYLRIFPEYSPGLTASIEASFAFKIDTRIEKSRICS